MEYKTICLHQFKRPTYYVHVEGVGNCTTCTQHEDNKNCKMYCPITVGEEEVHGGSSD